MQAVRSTVRALGALPAVLLTASVALAAGMPAVAASAAEAQPRAAAASARALSVAITGITPAVARPDATVTVTGTLANHTGSAVSGITVQAATSTDGFAFPAQMTDFSDGLAGGTSPLPLQPAGQSYQVSATVPNGASARWAVSFPAAAFYGQFGVFPVQVQAAGAGYAAAARTFLPYWPGGAAASQTKGLQTAWIWPLIDTPQQGACKQTLATSALARSVAPGGRLATLLDAGSAWSAGDQLTWAIDPALLSDVSVMTQPYFTHGNAECSERFREQPSQAAARWLAQLKTSTAGQQAFLTPYANVDVAALSHSVLDPSIEAAYRLGDTVAGQVLPATFGENGTGTGAGTVLKAAMPADGRADAGVLTSLADDGGINTVVLSTDELSADSTGGEDALARTVSGVGTSVSLLLASSRITSLLGSASAQATPASQFTLTQGFLAQTAMMAAEAPSTSRALVIAPPANWDPSPAEASALLSITRNAPWLHPAALSALSAAAAKLPSATHVVPKQVSGAELKENYLDKLAAVQGSVSVFKDLLYKPPAAQLNSLDAALAVTESSAWRGRGSPGGWLAMTLLDDYVTESENKVQMIASAKILLAGRSGETPVSVQNDLDQPVQVQVTAITPPGGQLRVDTLDRLLVVQGEKTGTLPIRVSSDTLGTVTVQLQLATQNGSPLTWPGTRQSLSVEVTRFGRSLLIMIGAALGILVLTSAYRLRRKRLAGARNGGSADNTADAGGAG